MQRGPDEPNRFKKTTQSPNALRSAISGQEGLDKVLNQTSLTHDKWNADQTQTFDQ